MSQSVYVWQRDWNTRVVDALETRGSQFSAVVVLSSEIGWTKSGPETVRVPVQWKALKALNRPIGAALRVGSLPGILSPGSKEFHQVRGELEHIQSEAVSNGVRLAELHLDFDSTEQQLPGYGEWLRALKDDFRDCRLAFTALPAWLRRAEFPAVAASADGYILQVHSFARPKNYAEDFSLCNPLLAESAVNRAAALGFPFTIALPSYGYSVAFDPAGNYLGISAESDRDWPAGSRLKEIRASPRELSVLVTRWQRLAPPHCQGIIWYRLPVPGDRRNWSWPTLQSVMRGETPAPVVQLSMIWRDSGLVEFQLGNTGQDETYLTGKVVLKWSGARLLAGDALRGFELIDSEPGHAQFLPSQSPPLILKPGDRAPVGWLRFSNKVQLHEEWQSP